jgi:hypothetical protein
MTLEGLHYLNISLFKYLNKYFKDKQLVCTAVYVTRIELLASHLTSKVKAYNLSAVRDFMFNIFTVSVSSECPSRLQREDRQNCCGDKGHTHTDIRAVGNKCNWDASRNSLQTEQHDSAPKLLHVVMCSCLIVSSSNNLADISECHIKKRQFLWF